MDDPNPPEHASRASSDPPPPHPNTAPQPPPPPHPNTAPQPPPPNPYTAPQPPPPDDGHGPFFLPAAPPRQPWTEPRTRRHDQARSRWGLGDAVASVAIYFLAGLALVVVLLALVGEDDLVDGPWLLVAVVGPQTMMLVHLVWVSRSKGLGLRADFGLSLNRTDIRLGLSLFAAALFGAGIVGAVTQAITGEQPTASAVELAQDSGSDGLTVWLILFGILGATFIPVVEELVFRGLLWGALEKRGMRPLPILVATSVLFSAIHLEPTRTPILFAVAMALGFGRYRTGRIGAPIVTHVLINSLAMSVTLIDLA